MLTAENIALFIVAIFVALTVAFLYDKLHAGRLDYRETHLESEVKGLRLTVDDQEGRLSSQQNEIQLLHRLLGEAQQRISYLEAEAAYYKRRADEAEMRAAKNNRPQQG